MRFLFTILLFTFFSLPALFGLNISDYRFHTTPETSYHGGIHSITKDSIGRIWFSGYDALFMYDGNSFTQMNHSSESLLPSSNWAYGQVIIDSSKRLYIATNHGLLRFSYQTKTFECVLAGNIGSIASSDDGTVWLIRDRKLESFHPDQLPNITHYPLPSDIVISALICIGERMYSVPRTNFCLNNRSSMLRKR